jgi:hypothetical protein
MTNEIPEIDDTFLADEPVTTEVSVLLMDEITAVVFLNDLMTWGGTAGLLDAMNETLWRLHTALYGKEPEKDAEFEYDELLTKVEEALLKLREGTL